MSGLHSSAADGLDLSVRTGEVHGFLGPNGAGKTTTLETCEGYRRAQSGSVRVLGLDPIRDRRALLPRIGVMLQSGGAWSGARAEEMLQHFSRLHAHPLPTDVLTERLALHECGRTPYRRLSGGQQQRLCIARTLAVEPTVILMDEPTSALDPLSTAKIEELIYDLKKEYTIIIVTHNMQQAARVSDKTSFFLLGKLIETNSTRKMFTKPDEKLTEDYITGRFG